MASAYASVDPALHSAAPSELSSAAADTHPHILPTLPAPSRFICSVDSSTRGRRDTLLTQRPWRQPSHGSTATSTLLQTKQTKTSCQSESTSRGGRGDERMAAAAIWHCLLAAAAAMAAATCRCSSMAAGQGPEAGPGSRAIRGSPAARGIRPSWRQLAKQTSDMASEKSTPPLYAVAALLLCLPLSIALFPLLDSLSAHVTPSFQDSAALLRDIIDPSAVYILTEGSQSIKSRQGKVNQVGRSTHTQIPMASCAGARLSGAIQTFLPAFHQHHITAAVFVHTQRSKTGRKNPVSGQYSNVLIRLWSAPKGAYRSSPNAVCDLGAYVSQLGNVVQELGPGGHASSAGTHRAVQLDLHSAPGLKWLGSRRRQVGEVGSN